MLATLAVLGPPVMMLATCGPPAEIDLHFSSLAPPPLPAQPAPSPAQFTDREFIADDGARLPLRRWLPKRPVKAVILALHGFGDYSHAFEMPAAIWARHGIATFAYDERGFGAAPGHGRWPGEGRLAVDAITASRILRLLYPGRPVYLLGESMGGAVAMLAATGAMQGVTPGPDGMPVAAIDGLILSAPAVWGRPTMQLIAKLALFAAVRLVPDMAMTGEGLKIRASDNDAMLRELARDPLVLKGARVDTVYGLVDLMDDALAAAPRLTRPMLLLYGAHDQVIPRLPIAAFVADLPPLPIQQQRLAYYPGGYHLLLRDLDRAIVAGDVANWVLDPAAPLPSHADALQAARPWPPEPLAGVAGAAAADRTAMPLAPTAPRH